MTCSLRAIWRIADVCGCPVAAGRTGQTAGSAGSADLAAMARATVCAIVHAAWRLKPPVTASTSSTSPAKYSPA